MRNDLMLDVGQANEIKLAARRARATNVDLKRLCEGDIFLKILPILRGTGEVIPKRHIIDLNADPSIPEGCVVEGHIKGGLFEWDPTKVKLYLSEKQSPCRFISADNLRDELEDKPVLNANLLDYLLLNPELIPDEWWDIGIAFWGTIFRSKTVEGIKWCVRILTRYDDTWTSYLEYSTYHFSDDIHAVIFHQ